MGGAVARTNASHAVPQLVSIRELAMRWQCYPSTVSRLLTKAQIRPYFLGSGKNGMKRYPLDEVEAYMASRRAP